MPASVDVTEEQNIMKSKGTSRHTLSSTRVPYTFGPNTADVFSFVFNCIMPPPATPAA